MSNYSFNEVSLIGRVGKEHFKTQILVNHFGFFEKKSENIHEAEKA